jgi:hypothetical protein
MQTERGQLLARVSSQPHGCGSPYTRNGTKYGNGVRQRWDRRREKIAPPNSEHDLDAVELGDFEVAALRSFVLTYSILPVVRSLVELQMHLLT